MQVLLDGKVLQHLASLQYLHDATPEETSVGSPLVMSTPSKTMLPVVTLPMFDCASRQEIALSVVVLPAPLTPSNTVTICPSGTDRLTPTQHLDHAGIDHVYVG